MNKLGIFMNFWEKNWNADHKKYIKKAAGIGFDVLEFQAQPLLEMSDDHIRELRKTADDAGIELTYSLGLDKRYDVSSLDEGVRLGSVRYLQNIIRKIAVGGGTLLSGVSYAGLGYAGRHGGQQTALLGAERQEHEGDHQGRRGVRRDVLRRGGQPV